MFYDEMERLVSHATRVGKIELADELANMLDREMDRSADIYKVCPDIDSYIHEVEQNLKAEELTWRHYEGDGNQRLKAVNDVVSDNTDPDYVYKLQQEGWNREQIEAIIGIAIMKYTG